MIEIGDLLPNLSLAVTDDTGAAADGGAVSLTITLPDQTVVSSPADFTVAHPSVGQYYVNYTTTQAGQHVVIWTVTGANAGVFTDVPYVEGTVPIVSLADVKAHLGVLRSSNDELLRSIALMASDACESPEGTNRRWRRRTVKDEIHQVASAFQLYSQPVISVTSLYSGSTLLADTDYDIDLGTGWVYELNGSFFSANRRFGIKVSYIAGATTIPPLVRNGVLEMCRHLYGSHLGGSRLPAQDEPDYTTSLAYLIPNRVAYAWQAYRMAG